MKEDNSTKLKEEYSKRKERGDKNLKERKEEMDKKIDNYFKQQKEKELKNAALDFMESENIYATSANKLRIDKEMLLDKGYLYIKDIPKEKECVGYALGFYDDSNNEYKAQAYLNCKHYTTKK